jgi:hypothetical protein
MRALAATAMEGKLAEECEAVLISRTSNPKEHEVARWAALGAALQIALVHPSLRFGLMALLVRVKVAGNQPEFLRRVANVAGMAHSHWPDPSLKEVLERLAEEPTARDEALFELGMSALREGLDANSPSAVDVRFEEARRLFDTCLVAREHRPDARSYSGALSLLSALRRGESAHELRRRAKDVSFEVTVAAAWSRSADEGWKWMGARWSELQRWNDLAGQVAELGENVESAFDTKAELVIRQRLLGIYVANRAVLGRGAGGVETFIRPRLAAGLLRRESTLDAMLAWLEAERASPTSEWREAATELLEELHEGKRRGGGASALIAAPLPALQGPDAECRRVAEEVAESAFAAMAASLSPELERIFGKIVPALKDCADYAKAEARKAVDAVLWNLLLFLADRMDSTRGNDWSCHYLFADTERGHASPSPAPAPLSNTGLAKVVGKGKTGAKAGAGAGGKAKAKAKAKAKQDKRDYFEKALQLDCQRFLRAPLGRCARLEVSDVAGGRADILVELFRTRLVIEVKREDLDASHDTLVRKYGGQATEYSNTSARIGFLLVLDRSRPDGSAGHIEDKVSFRMVPKSGDSSSRALVIVVMPGRRRRPSAIA